MQCKDIPDDVFMSAVQAARANSAGWRSRWDVHETLNEAMDIDVPEKLLMAKARKLEAREILGGCTCGCRGDWHPADECQHRGMCCR
jgi:hypothetical protein